MSIFSRDCLSVIVKTTLYPRTHATSASAHAGVAGSSFDDRAAGLQQSLALGFVDHRDGDAVLHGAARIQIIGFHVHFGGNVFRTRFRRIRGVLPIASRMLLHFIDGIFSCKTAVQSRLETSAKPVQRSFLNP